MYRVKSVSIEGMRNTKRRTYTFDDSFTYVHGPNGSGKSTVLNAIQLALLGYVPGTAKNNTAIMAHASGPELRVSVDLSNGTNDVTVTRTFKRKGSSATSSVSVNPPDFDLESVLGSSQLPIFDWFEFVGMTSNKLKDWFVGFIPGMNETVNWSDELSSSLDFNVVYNPDIVQEYATKLSKESEDKSAQESVQQANKTLRSELSYYKAMLSDKESAINGLVESEDSLLSEEDVLSKLSQLRAEKENVESEVSNLESNWNDLVSKYSSRKAAQDYCDKVRSSVPTQDEIDSMVEQINKMDLEVSTHRNTLNELETSLKDTTSVVESYQLSVSNYRRQLSEIDGILKSPDTCPYTKSKCDTLSNVKSDYEEKASSLRSAVESETSNLVNARNNVESVKSSISEVKDKISSLVSQRSNLENNVTYMSSTMRKFEQQTEILNQLDNVSEEEVSEAKANVDAARLHKDEITQQIAEVNQLLKNVKLIESLTQQKYKLEERIAALNVWSKLTGPNGLQTTLSSGGFSVLEDQLTVEVEKVFGPGTKCKFNVSTKANSFSFGIDRNGSYIPYNLLSTGEKTLYTFVLMKYIALNSNSDVSVVMMDDFFDHLDKDNFNSIVNVIKSSSDVQVIVAGVLPCEEKDVNVVEL